jgi:membrane protein implicated in regulation of membrane protease activity
MPYRGRLFVLQAAIENQCGRLVVDGGPWLISGPDCPPGTTVRVIGVEGARLKVRPEATAEAFRPDAGGAELGRVSGDQ